MKKILLTISIMIVYCSLWANEFLPQILDQERANS